MSTSAHRFRRSSARWRSGNDGVKAAATQRCALQERGSAAAALGSATAVQRGLIGANGTVMGVRDVQ